LLNICIKIISPALHIQIRPLIHLSSRLRAAGPAAAGPGVSAGAFPEDFSLRNRPALESEKSVPRLSGRFLEPRAGLQRTAASGPIFQAQKNCLFPAASVGRLNRISSCKKPLPAQIPGNWNRQNAVSGGCRAGTRPRPSSRSRRGGRSSAEAEAKAA
jgi:hypothetical protein